MVEVGGIEPVLTLDNVLRLDSAVFGRLPDVRSVGATLQWTVRGEGLRGSGLRTLGDRSSGEGLPWLLAWDWLLGGVGCGD